MSRSLAKSFTTRMFQFLCCTCRMRPIKPFCGSVLSHSESEHLAFGMDQYFLVSGTSNAPVSFTHDTKVLSRVLRCKIWQFRPFHFIWRSLAVVLPRWKVRFAINFKRRFRRSFAVRLGNLLPLVLNSLPNCRAAPPLPGIAPTPQVAPSLPRS